MPHNSEPSENWDDDFEFNNNKTTRQPDEDHDQDADQDQRAQRPRRESHETTTENWDDDFEEDEPEPGPAPLPPPPAAKPRTPSGSSKNRTPRARRTRSGSGSTARQATGWDSSDDEELGFAGEHDEDRTVTARSRPALGSSSSSAFTSNSFPSGTPPPPVPPLPLGLGIAIPVRDIPPPPSGGVLQPFPRSPTTSVFSAPDTLSTYTHTSAGSTTALTRPHQVRGLAALPPSPPLHRERERKTRRLRKKSRPGGGAVEMREMPQTGDAQVQPQMGHAQQATSSSEGSYGTGMAEEEEVEDWDAEVGIGGRLATPPRSGGVHYADGGGVRYANANGANASGSNITNASGSNVALAIGSPGLLSRIGSVKKWAAAAGRRKKGSSVSLGSEQAFDTDLDVIPDIASAAAAAANTSLFRAGSQSSSRSRHSYAQPDSLPHTPPPKPARYSSASPPQEHYSAEQTRGGWFFRGASAGSPPSERSGRFRMGGGGGGGVGRDGSAAEGVSERPYTPTPHGGEKEKEKDREKGEGKTKLVKRRSLGFVQIRRGIRPLNGSGADVGDEGAHETTPRANPHPKSTPDASPVKAAYAGLGVGRPSGAAVGSVEDLGRQKEKEREGMGFVERNVRRISLVGGTRHKRTKSGVSVTGLGLSSDEKENDGKGKKRAGKPPPDSLPPPPVDVQLHPPSPPQTVRSASGSIATMKPSAPINIASARTLEPLPTAFSPTFSISSSAASPISHASSSSPSLTPYSGASMSPPRSHVNAPSPKAPVSPHSASLGRSAVISPAVNGATVSTSAGGAGTMRRNSLGDLKIPARISQAQVGLRRDLGMVREFARNVEELKELQDTYQALVSEVQGILDMHVLHPTQPKESSRVSSPTFFKRHRSNTSSSNPGASSQPPSEIQTQQQAYKQLASAFYTINSKYRISWECAELLIELGGGGSANAPPSTSTSAPVMSAAGGSDGRKSKGRERAITLQDDAKVPPSPGPLTTAASVGTIPGPPLASPPSNLAWRASTGRNDLSQRQLLLLKEMLGNPVPGGPDDSFGGEDGIPEEGTGNFATVNREWRWGDAMNSTVTLPSEESGVQGAAGAKQKKRRSSRLRMSGIREMLRLLTKGGAPPPPPPVPSSTTTSSGTQSSVDVNAGAQHQQHLYEHRQVPTQGKRRRAKTSVGPESVRSNHRPLSPFDPPSLKTASPRRPSLASIFRLGKNRTPPSSAAAADVSMDSAKGGDLYPTFSGISGGRESASNSTGDEEDWDRMEDSASDVDAAARARRGGSTIRGRSPYLHSSFLAPAQSPRPTTPARSPSGSRTSILLNDHAAAPARATRLSNVEEHAGVRSTSKAESPSRQFSRSRRVGKTGSVRSMPPATLPDPKLAMTPENIKPLLENAREVHARLSDCIAEIRELLAARP
ncbi:hypothetical protein B0H10DRAFT_2109893 [Mycena sp. CBHHK59/15]|nr:hypothetical protein B0H10DRAFT_2109893 [Mycena sp. CBHHK59/15]